MVLITEQSGEGLNVQENGVAAGKSEIRTKKMALDTSIDSINEDQEEKDEDKYEIEIDYTHNYWEDDDDVYQEFEELDFEALPDRIDSRSVASDDSFYPPDSSIVCSVYRAPSPESPEPISFFKACCNNNPIIVKIMIRQGVTEEEVHETDRNRRVGGSVSLMIY